jgi:hypothetical protein
MNPERSQRTAPQAKNRRNLPRTGVSDERRFRVALFPKVHTEMCGLLIRDDQKRVMGKTGRRGRSFRDRIELRFLRELQSGAHCT